MLTGDEIARSTQAAVGLFRGDPRALRLLDVSYEGFWRSFQVFFLLLPFLGVLILSEKATLLNHLPVIDETFPTGPFVTSRVAGFALDWMLYPVALAALARPLGLNRRFVPLVVALNWAALVAAVPVVVPQLLMLLGLVGEELGAVLNLVMLAVVLRYQYVVTRIATAAPAGFCAGLVALDVVIGLAVSAATRVVAGI